MTIIPLHEPHFINPGLHTEIEHAVSRFDGTLLLILAASAIMTGLIIVGGYDVASRFWAWV